MRRLQRFSIAWLALVLMTAGLVWWLRTPSHPIVLAATSPESTGHIPTPTNGLAHKVHLAAGQNIVCKDCHEIRAEGFVKPTPDRCRTCHGDRQVGIHASTIAKEKGANDCTTCHAFVSRPMDDKDPWACMRCHSEPQGDKIAISVHAKEDCGTCHEPHRAPATIATDCRSCHDNKRAKMHPLKNEAQACVDCHKPHRKAPRGGDACTGCHFEKKPIVPETAIFTGGHQCTSCHTSHEHGASIGTSCKQCHAKQHVIGMEKNPMHADCRSCHDQHNVMGAPGNRCVRCHAEPHQKIGKTIDVSRGCTSCHDVHGKEGRTLTPAGGGTDCASCHGKIAATNRSFHDGKAECASCHATHGSNPLGPRKIVPCAQCHEKKTELVAMNTGHAECRNCHVPHAPLPPKTACIGCHNAEGQTAPQGHQKCTGCHDPHSGQKPACTNGCHQDKRTSIHGTIDGGCQKCHRPHGPKGIASPPACTSCHAANKLPALHTVPQHANCRSCHTTPHQPPPADRAACTGSCHTDRRNHIPGATRCTGCHDFRGGP
jgi:predicted CXXCH cytochrome family protein